MKKNKSKTAKRLEQGYYKKYQVNIDSGELSLPLLKKFTAAFENSMRRFPDCYVFRFRLKVPQTFNKNRANKLLNDWFYSLAKQLPANMLKTKGKLTLDEGPNTEGINMIWAKDKTSNHTIIYHAALFFRAPKVPTELSLLKAQDFFKRKIVLTWAYALYLDESVAQSLCLFPTHNITPLARSSKAYNEHLRYCFYILSTLARTPRFHSENLDNVLGIKFSRNMSVGRKKKRNAYNPRIN